MGMGTEAMGDFAHELEISGSLSPVLGGEGWGEGPFTRAAQSAERPLTLSPEYRGEGTST